jgi:hypothetical protein
VTKFAVFSGLQQPRVAKILLIKDLDSRILSAKELQVVVAFGGGDSPHVLSGWKWGHYSAQFKDSYFAEIGCKCRGLGSGCKEVLLQKTSGRRGLTRAIFT